MKSKKFLLGLLVFILAFGMIVTGCDPNEGNGNGNGNGNGGNITGVESPWWIEAVADGQTLDVHVDNYGTDNFELRITVGGTPNSTAWHRTLVNYKYEDNFAYKAGKRYQISFQAKTETGERALMTNYIFSGGNTVNEVNFLFPTVTLTDQYQTFTMVTRNIPSYAVMTGHSFKFFCANVIGTFYIKDFSIIETTDPTTERSLSDRAGRHIASESSGITLGWEIIEDAFNGDYIKVTKGGTEYDYQHWYAQFQFSYNGEVGKRYKYVFNAWTDSDTYEFGWLEYGWDPVAQRTFRLSTGVYSNPFTIDTDSEKVYELIGADALTFAGYSNISFLCGTRNGTFNLRFITIEETNEEPPVVLADLVWGHTDENYNINLDYNIINNDYIQITVSGDISSIYDSWQAIFYYNYTGFFGKSYEIKFNAWTEDGTFTIGGITYEAYWDTVIEEWVDKNIDTSAYSGNVHDNHRLVIDTNQNYVYTFTPPPLISPYIDEWNPSLRFMCGGQEGTFYLRIISIEEVQ